MSGGGSVGGWSSYTFNLTITPVLNGTAQATSTQTVLRGERANPSQPSGYSSYTFGGWYTNQACTTSWTANSRIENDTTLFAKYTTVQYTVTKYKVLDGGTPISIGSESVNSGTNYPVPANRYEAGYTFDGWYTTSACTTKYTAREINANTGIYAKYTSGTWSGSVTIDLGNSGWADAAANYAILFMDKTTYPTEIDQWSTYLTGTQAGTYQISVPYDIGFAPKTMLIARYNSSYSQSSWNTNKWPGSTYAWGQTDDIDFGTYVIVSELNDSKNAASVYFPVIKGGATGSWTDKAILSNYKVNSDNGHVEYYSTSVTFAKNDTFKSVVPSSAGDKYYAAYSTHISLTSNFTGDGYNNITVNIAGTYAFYLDSVTRSVYITKVEIAEADEWAQYFLSHVGCDATGRNLPSGWTACATEYAKLSGPAKNIVYGATAKESGTYVEQAVARYDVAVRNHSSLTKFIVNSSDTPRSAAINVNPIAQAVANSGSMIAIIAISSVSIAAIGGYFLFKKKKND